MDGNKFAWICSSQAGVFTRGQAIACGLSSKKATDSIKNGYWQRVAGRGFVLRGTPVGIAQGAWAAALSVPRAVIWGPSALGLHDPQTPLPRLGVILVAAEGVMRDPVRIKVRRIAIPPDERDMLRGLTVQRRTAALVDSLAWLDNASADRLFAWAVARDVVTHDLFASTVAGRARSRGHCRLAAYCEMFRAGAASKLEVIAHAILRRRKITGWDTNVSIRIGSGLLARVDILFRAAKLIVEIDGFAAHSSKEAFQKDRTRQNALIAAGYQILRFTWDDLVSRPDQFADAIEHQIRNNSAR
ncbi:MAG: endonuclease domain-containing protein [Bifidobacteriaceae bacterium]|jgi:very-short-patch-repair endonuclease|nr:endonuclease domain-containing protein [Bifidobacteriaceae bacterium]